MCVFREITTYIKKLYYNYINNDLYNLYRLILR